MMLSLPESTSIQSISKCTILHLQELTGILGYAFVSWKAFLGLLSHEIERRIQNQVEQLRWILLQK